MPQKAASEGKCLQGSSAKHFPRGIPYGSSDSGLLQLVLLQTLVCNIEGAGRKRCLLLACASELVANKFAVRLYSRGRGGKLRIKDQKVGAVKLITSSHNQQHRKAASEGKCLQGSSAMHFPWGIPYGSGDSGLLQLVLLQTLICNRRALEGGGSQITGQSAGDWLYV